MDDLIRTMARVDAERIQPGSTTCNHPTTHRVLCHLWKCSKCGAILEYNVKPVERTEALKALYGNGELQGQLFLA